MRWESLSVVPDGPPEHDATRAAPPLPLALPNAVVRTFDTPGFAGMTFYEVRSKSIINRVPNASRVPFEWTINPYRGCSHACTYCLAGQTPVLMADGRTKPLADLRPGDSIYGTVRADGGRICAVTRVLDHWSTTKPAYRVTLSDGTELIASGDHRFLSGRGWAHVAAAPAERLTIGIGDRLVGPGRPTETPADTADYRSGYLCGVIRGDGNGEGDLGEAMSRARAYLGEFRAAGIPGGSGVAGEWPGGSGVAGGSGVLDGFGVAGGSGVLDGLGVAGEGSGGSGRDGLATLAALIRWPRAQSDCWRRGFLAGIFDSDGGRDRHLLWISGSDDTLLRQTLNALRHFGFNAVIEDQRLPTGVRTVLVGGGLSEQLRFKHLFDPAIDTNWDLTGAPIEDGTDLRVTAVEPLGVELPLYDITTGTGDFIANGVVSHNCFARNTHTYLDLDAGHDFDSKVIVKVNAGELLRKELGATRWRGDHIAMGTNVDCYQRAEGRYRLMREIIAGLRDFANPFSILTKGTLILRDLDLLRQAAEVTHVGVSFSIGFVDEALWRSVEPGTPSPRRRLDAVRALTDAGFDVGVLMAPILPGLTDGDESIEATVAAIAAAGAASVTPIPLHLRRGAREWYAAWLARTFPDLVPRYRALYRRGSYLPEAYQRDVAARVRAVAARHGLDRASSSQARRLPEPPQPAEPDAVQLTLL